MEQTARLVIPDEDIAPMIVTLCKSDYWVRVNPLSDGKSLILIRKDED